MGIKHFSHEHPLSIFNKEAHKNESCEEVVCYGCQISIDDDSSTAYECVTCNFFLHKQCAEAPTEITHTMHSEHPLTLLSHPSTCGCNVCGREDWKWFTYNCSQCEFDIDIVCALKDKVDRRFEHESHPHPLTVQLRPALFRCDACGRKSEDYSYLCTTCPFWIHKTCALLPSTMKLISHPNHTLKLTYSLPDMHRGYGHDCLICRKKLHPIDWLYYCGNCRYFVHVKCATTSNATPEPLSKSDDEDYQHLDQFPIPDARSTAHLMSKYIKKMSLGDANCDEEGEIKIDHWNHDHPLILWDGQSKNELNTNIVYDGMLCVACMQPITAPFYHCSECSYFLHKYCAVLPLELPHPGHPSHPDHPLKISYKTKDLSYFGCYYCGMGSSGFCYHCEICKVKIDIRCASLPSKILHKSHKHPLVTSKVSGKCDACNRRFSGSGYKCETEICRYYLHYKCATMLPRTLTHDYDEHPIALTYPPIENHPSEFYCEICEEEIHPKNWLYYCRECSFSFHIGCLYPIDLYSNVTFGDKYEVNNHQHPVRFVRHGGNKSPCAICGEDEKGHPVLECGDRECGFKICVYCALKQRVRKLILVDMDESFLI